MQNYICTNAGNETDLFIQIKRRSEELTKNLPQLLNIDIERINIIGLHYLYGWLLFKIDDSLDMELVKMILTALNFNLA